MSPTRSMRPKIFDTVGSVGMNTFSYVDHDECEFPTFISSAAAAVLSLKAPPVQYMVEATGSITLLTLYKMWYGQRFDVGRAQHQQFVELVQKNI